MKQEANKSKKFGASTKRLGVNNEIGITNYSDILFYGELFLGSENEKLNVMFDTSYDWLLIEGENCLSCKGKTYEFSKSDVFETVKSI